ncbi:MAG: right-handed parallel beta-helix repeat-containing protein [Gammaproteobacteria bacterium]|nr:right-handed parallel beta-helix repeat-containing protein [Gammaproteobacteria bacterium]
MLKKYFIAMTLNLYFVSTCVSATVYPLGILNNHYSVQHQGNNSYQLILIQPDVLSIFLNGLNAGYTIALYDQKNFLLDSSNCLGVVDYAYRGPKPKDGPIVLFLKPGNYTIQVTHSPIHPALRYRNTDMTYTLNLLLDHAPKTLVVAASDSAVVGQPLLSGNGKNDTQMLNDAITLLKKMQGGTLILRPGTYHINESILTTLNNLTVTGTGWRTVLRLTDGAKLYRAGIFRSRFMDNAPNDKQRYFSNQHFMHLAMDGNKMSKPYYQTAVGNFGTYLDSSFEDIHMHHFPRYGFDPHGNDFGPTTTKRLTIKNCLADHNDEDGIVCDTCADSLIQNNITDANGRHGINICTGALNNIVERNVVTNNGVNGITVQPGQAHGLLLSNNNKLSLNFISNNLRSGIYIYHGHLNTVLNNKIGYSGENDIHARAVTNNLIQNNMIYNQSARGMLKTAIYLSATDLGSTFNQIISNHIQAANKGTYEYAIAESSGANDYNLFADNHLPYPQTPIRVVGVHTQTRNNQ